MSDLSEYRTKVTEFGKAAKIAEEQKDYQKAFDNYKSALTIFQHLLKYEKNANLKQVYQEKMKQYLDRAEYIKKQVLSAPEHQIAPEEPPSGGDSGASATAKKPSKKKGEGDDDDEKAKL